MIMIKGFTIYITWFLNKLEIGVNCNHHSYTFFAGLIVCFTIVEESQILKRVRA